MSDLAIRPVQPSDREALAALLGADNHGCHCMYWHFEGHPNGWLERCHVTPEENRTAFEGALERGDDAAAGLVALDGDALVGWLKLTRAGSLTKLYAQRLYRGLPCFDGPRDDVLTVGCLRVAPHARRRGVASALIGAVADEARRRGARAVEALPRRPREWVRDEELLMGPVSAYLRAGFVEVHAMDAYPVLRLDLDADS